MHETARRLGRAKCNEQRAADDVPRRTGNEQTSTETPSASRSGDLPILSWNVPEWPYDLKSTFDHFLAQLSAPRFFTYSVDWRRLMKNNSRPARVPSARLGFGRSGRFAWYSHGHRHNYAHGAVVSARPPLAAAPLPLVAQSARRRGGSRPWRRGRGRCRGHENPHAHRPCETWTAVQLGNAAAGSHERPIPSSRRERLPASFRTMRFYPSDSHRQSRRALMKFNPNPRRLTNAPEKAPFCQAPVVNEAATRRACASHRHPLPNASGRESRAWPDA
jgi:hypothetical protein